MQRGSIYEDPNCLSSSYLSKTKEAEDDKSGRSGTVVALEYHK